jgi:hypothetical protein
MPTLTTAVIIIVIERKANEGINKKLSLAGGDNNGN